MYLDSVPDCCPSFIMDCVESFYFIQSRNLAMGQYFLDSFTTCGQRWLHPTAFFPDRILLFLSE